MELKLKVYAVIVSFNPDLNVFGKNLATISRQVDKIIVVDNSDCEKKQIALENYLAGMPYIYLVQPKENLGIAYAQNIGFVCALKDSADYVITFDQDSSVEDGLINSLFDEFKTVLEGKDIKIACIGPSVVNERTDIRYEKYFHSSTQITETVYSVNSIISSGTLYNVEVFSVIGLNKAEWFIDSIDIEWCYRARYLGYHVLMTTKVAMKHNLGINDIKLPLGKSINIGSPSRLYYVYRNWLFSIREPQFNWKYKIKLLVMMPIKFLIFSVIPPRKSRIIFMLRGIKDGLLKRHSLSK
ncbi:glycosyltransferase family 2 protein [Aeromonas media]|uniref:glycosyltransferase family 2 protein n=1 Tax=Aeromonas media TaxID=651 RepID=UPI003D202822